MRRVRLARTWLLLLGLLLIRPASGPASRPAAAWPLPDAFRLKFVDATWVTDRISGWATSVSLLENPGYPVSPDLERLTVAFTHEVDLPSLRQALTLTDAAGQAVPIADVKLYLADGYVGEYQYVVTLPGPLAAKTRYTLTVGGSVRDFARHPLGAAVPVPFATSGPPGRDAGPGPGRADSAPVFAPGAARRRTLTSWHTL